MPDFEYRVVSPSGEIVKSSRNSPTKESLARELRKEGCLVLGVKSEKQGRLSSLKTKWRVKREVRSFTEEMSVLLGSGFTLENSISILRDSASAHFKEVLEGIFSNIREGQSMTRALERHHEHFSRFYVGMIQAGEEGGDLPRVFRQLADYQENAARIRSDILSAIIYPAILFIVGMISILVLMLYIIPKFSSIFSEMGVVTPLSTRILTGLSNLIISFGWIGAGLGIAAFIFFKNRLRDTSFRLAFDRKRLNMPILGELFLKREIARFARGLGSLLSEGVDILRAIDIMKNLLPNQYFREITERVKRDIREGGYLSVALKESSVVPEKHIQLIKVGEHTGRLGEMLLRVADISERELNEKVKRAVVLIEPAVILLMGVVIGSVVVSMLLAIFSINDVAF